MAVCARHELEAQRHACVIHLIYHGLCSVLLAGLLFLSWVCPLAESSKDAQRDGKTRSIHADPNCPVCGCTSLASAHTSGIIRSWYATIAIVDGELYHHALHALGSEIAG